MHVEGTPAQTPPSNADNGPRNLGLALLVISAAQLMVVLDGSIVNIALPRILGDTSLGFDQSSLTWMITGYGIAFGGLLLLGGRIGDLIGRRKVFIAGILIFTLASLWAGWRRPSGSCSRLAPCRGPAPRLRRRPHSP
jgi:predicted MFS family arabinose efflux permease